MQCIRTRYVGPTNTRGSRVSAQCESGRLTLPWDCALSSEENHAAAAKALAEKLGMVLPAPVSGGDYYHAFIPREYLNAWNGRARLLSAARDLLAHLPSCLDSLPESVRQSADALRAVCAEA